MPLPFLDQQFYREEHLFVHLRHQVVMLDSEAVTLHPIEYRRLALLVKHAGEVVPRAIILKQLWGDAPDIPRHRADPDNWKLIVNRQTGQGGHIYNARMDLGRVDMKMDKPKAPVEKLRYTITNRRLDGRPQPTQ